MALETGPGDLGSARERLLELLELGVIRRGCLGADKAGVMANVTSKTARESLR